MHIHDILDVYKHMQCSDVTGGILLQGKFEFLGYIRWYLRPFWTMQG